MLACKTSKPVIRPYKEDLSVYRMELPEVKDVASVPKILKGPVRLYGHITEEIDSISNLIVIQNKKLNVMIGLEPAAGGENSRVGHRVNQPGKKAYI